MPLRIDFSVVGDRYWCVVSDNLVDTQSVINEDVYTGFSDDKEIALSKALSERCERLSFISGLKRKDPSCATERSDGFAALPLSFSIDQVRANGLNEAVERFVWATWWDNSEISFEISELFIKDNKVQSSEYLKVVFTDLNLESLKIIKPCIQGNQFEVQIIFGKIKGKGFISGGACGSSLDSGATLYRGLDEMYRHGLAHLRSTEKNIEPITLYEKRLLFFATGEGNSIVENRLMKKGSNSVLLPELAIDSPVEPKFDGYQVYRCYFKDQPPFVGGAMERLCL